MYKLYLILFMLLLFESEGLQPLCSITKANNMCICKRVTIDNVPVTIADCSRIKLQELPDQTQLNNDLNVLDFSFNEIGKLENRYSSPSVETLQLSYNYIHSINDGFLDGLPNLRNLSLSHNNLTSLSNIFQNSKQLAFLDLSFNDIETVPDNVFLPLEGLKSLDLSYNDVSLGEWLTESPDALYTKLGLTTNLSHLIMDNLGLQRLQNLYFLNHTNLKYLSLADNYIENVPNIPYSVEYLDLSGSAITILQARYLNYHSLKTLILNRMKKLETIESYAFYNLQSLEELSISGCRKLHEFNELVFGTITKTTTLTLTSLSLAKNSLQTLNETFKYVFDTLDHVDLRDNPWTCNCDLLWFQEFDNFYKKDLVRCTSPPYLANRMVFELGEEDMPTCFPERYGKKSHRILIPVLILLVIVLSALVGYLIYYAPSWYGQRSRGIGPHSPYSATRMDDDI